MLSLALTILSGLGGGIMRLLPELLGLWNKKTDNSHELAMMDKQIELQRLKGADDRATLALQGEQERFTLDVKGGHEEFLAALDLHKEALRGQMQVTGNKFIDGMTALVRPATTYYFLSCYGIVKSAMIMIAWRQDSAWGAIAKCWTAEDAAMLWAILNFWFVGRVIDKRRQGQ